MESIGAAVEEWRKRYLSVKKAHLALVEYLDSPDATVAGAKEVLATAECDGSTV